MLGMFKLLKIERKSRILSQFVTPLSLMSHGGGELEYSKCPRKEGHRRSEDLSRDKFLGVLPHCGSKSSSGLANFDFKIL